MTIFGTIYDSNTHIGIPGASISVVDKDGMALGQGIAADNTGWFQLISPLLDQGNQIAISSVGYDSVLANPNVFVSTAGLGLNPQGQELSAVTVTPGAKNYTPYLVGGGVLAAMLLLGGKKKKKAIGGLNAQSQTLLIGGAVVLVGGYFLVKKLIPSLNPFPAAANPVDETATKAAQAAALAQAKQSGQSATYSADQYIGWANDIYKLGTASTPDQSAIVNDIVNVNNMVDLQSLITAFGTKQGGGFMCANFNMYCDTYDLNSFVKATLDTQHINNINLYLSAQGINYTF
jgi:hypothetical protein